MKVAIFDLGTNVFNLLVARIVEGGGFRIESIIKEASFIGRASGSSGVLPEEAIRNSVEAIAKMIARCPDFDKIDVVKAVATSAVREADNGEDFVRAIKTACNIDVEIISGDREAELIYKGIRESMFLYDENVLMLDIGGGSCEFIMANRDIILWKESFRVGVAELKKRIDPSDPIRGDEILRFTNVMDGTLKSLQEQVGLHKPKVLIGSSGSFDTIREIMFPEDDGSLPAMELPMNRFDTLYTRLLDSTREERAAMPKMPAIRVDYIVIGAMIVNYVIEKSGVKEMLQSSFSLKEGYAAEINSKAVTEGMNTIK